MSKVLIQALKELDVDKVLIENVASMPTEWRDYFTQTFKEIFPDISLYLEDSAKSSPQSRKRFYWTNIIYNDIKDEGMVLNDILEDGAMADRDKSHCLDANYFKGGNLEHYYKKSRRQVVFVQGEKIAIKSKKCRQVGTADLKGYDIIKRVYSRWGKSPTLTTMQGGWRMPKVDVDSIQWRALTPLECERLQTVPDGCTQYGVFLDDRWSDAPHDVKKISNSQRYKMLGNGFCVSTIANILKGVDHG
jgi:site-specific DNA-cytosine methylase